MNEATMIVDKKEAGVDYNALERIEFYVYVDGKSYCITKIEEKEQNNDY